MMSCEARVTELQNEANSLRRQVDELKLFLETQLERMQTDIQAQLNEAKQLLVQRESVSVARIVELEREVADLTRLCEQALRKEELLCSLTEEENYGERHLRSAVSPSQIAFPKPALPDPLDDDDDGFSDDQVLSIQQSGAAEPVRSPKESSAEADIADLRSRLDEVYDFYTSASVVNADQLDPVMHLSHFTAMVHDAGLCAGRSPVAPELLWMDVPRNLAPKSARGDCAGRRAGSTLLLPRAYDDDGGVSDAHASKSRFARARLQCILREQFCKALRVVCAATSAMSGCLPPSPQQFRSFLLNVFLPAVEERTLGQRSTEASRKMKQITTETKRSSASGSRENFAAQDDELDMPLADVVSAYMTDDCRGAMKQFAARTKEAFLKAVRAPPQCTLSKARMNFASFLEFSREHHLLPLVSKLQLRSVFRFAMSKQTLSASSRDDQCISYAGFATSLFCLAELIYGRDAHLRQQYPSPYARLTKLLLKMFVL